MPIKSKKDLETNTAISAEDKSDIQALFDALSGAETRVSALTKKSEDVDKVIAKNAELEAAVRDRDTKATALQAKLDALSAPVPHAVATEEKSLFSVFEEIIDDLLGSDETPSKPGN